MDEKTAIAKQKRYLKELIAFYSDLIQKQEVLTVEAMKKAKQLNDATKEKTKYTFMANLSDGNILAKLASQQFGMIEDLETKQNSLQNRLNSLEK